MTCTGYLVLEKNIPKTTYPISYFLDCPPPPFGINFKAMYSRMLYDNLPKSERNWTNGSRERDENMFLSTTA